MKLRTPRQLLRRDPTPDHERRSSSQQNLGDPERANDETDPAEHDGTAEEDLEHEDEDDKEADSNVQLRNPRRQSKLSRFFSFIFPSPSSEEEIQLYLPHYRYLPILSGIVIPFAILLDIPGLTERWYIHTSDGVIVSSKPTPALLEAGAALSLLCAVLANLCLIMRFLERRIMMMTILCIIFLTIHDILSILTLATFDVAKDDYTFGQAFWMTLCSTIVSSITNLTLIIDFVRTPNFRQSGSGLTRKQRSLVIIIIGLFCYIGLGALVNALLLNLTFINGLYFTVVTIETIGFGDIVPDSTSSRVFICFYATLGIINIAFVVGYFRETVLEGLDFGYRRRILAIQERRRTAQRQRRAETRWRTAVAWRLRERNARVWIPEKGRDDHRSLWSKLCSRFWHFVWRVRSRMTSKSQSHSWYGMELNLKALPHVELEAAALEAGVPLNTLLPPEFYESYEREPLPQRSDTDQASPFWWFVQPVYGRDARDSQPLTYHRLGTMAAFLTKVGVAFSESGATKRSLDAEQASSTVRPEISHFGSSTSLHSSSVDDTEDYRSVVEETEKSAYYVRATLSSAWFLIFWMGGAAIFMATESWSYGKSVYFCFIAFTTIGYGDLAPRTPAGRCIFVVWALVGVATMTIFISIVAEAYTSRYKNIIGRDSFNKAVQKYRRRTRAELSEKSQGGSVVVRFDLQETIFPGATEVQAASSTAKDTADGPSATRTQELHEADTRAQMLLEQLPEHVLTESRSLQGYLRLVGDGDGQTADVERLADEKLWNLMDDVVGRKKLTDATKAEILRDDESRRALVLLGMERSIRDLVSIAEQALAAVHERDQIIASFEQGKESGEAESSAT